MDVAHQVCIIYAVVNGFVNDIEVEKLAAFEQRLYEYMDNSHPNVLNAIRTTGKLEKETEDELKAAIGELKVEFTVAK